MVDTKKELDKFLASAKKVRYYRDIRFNPKFLEREKQGVISFIREEEVDAILKEDDLYSETNIRNLVNIRDLIVFQNRLSNDALEDIDFSLLLKGTISDLALLRVYKEIDLLSLEYEVRNVVEERFVNLINEYVNEELLEAAGEQIKQDNMIFSSDALQKAQEAEVGDTITELTLKRKVRDEILSNYVSLLILHLDEVDSTTEQFKDTCRFIHNMFFVNKNLERYNEFLYNGYTKNVSFDMDMWATIHGCSRSVVDGVRTDVLLDCYDYGVELLFRNEDYNTGIMYDLIGIYLDTVQSLLSKYEIESLFIIIDDNYMLSGQDNDKNSRASLIKKDLENRVYMNEEKCIRGKTYIKGD